MTLRVQEKSSNPLSGFQHCFTPTSAPEILRLEGTAPTSLRPVLRPDNGQGRAKLSKLDQQGTRD
ncbi:MAG: hypothetical protein U0271_22655 [Polyangiaceae bacterium]